MHPNTSVSDQNWVKFPSLVFEIWCSHGFRDTQTRSQSHTPKRYASGIESFWWLKHKNVWNFSRALVDLAMSITTAECSIHLIPGISKHEARADIWLCLLLVRRSNYHSKGNSWQVMHILLKSRQSLQAIRLKICWYLYKQAIVICTRPARKVIVF